MTTTYTYANSFSSGGVGINSLTVNAYKGSRFASPPALNASPPGGGADATTTTGTAAGFAGAFAIALPTSEDYYISVSYSGSTYWLGPVYGMMADGTAQGGTASAGTIGPAGFNPSPVMYVPYSLPATAAGTSGLQILPVGESFVANCPHPGTSPGLLVGGDNTQGGVVIAYTGLNNQYFNITQPASGSFTLSLGGFTTSSLTTGQSASAIQTALRALNGGAFPNVTAISTNVNGSTVVQVQTAGYGTLTAAGASISGQSANQLFNNHIFQVQDQNNLPILWAGSRVGSSAGFYNSLGSYADRYTALGWWNEANPTASAYTLMPTAILPSALGGGHGYAWFNKYGSSNLDIGSAPNFWGNGLNVQPLIAPATYAQTTSTPTAQYAWNFTPPTGGTYTLTLNSITTATIDTTKSIYTLTPSGSYTLTLNGQTTSSIAFNASASTIASDLNGLSGVSGVTVSASGGQFIVTAASSYGALTSSAGAGFVSTQTTLTTIQNALNAVSTSVNINGVGIFGTASPYQINYPQTLGTTFTLNLGTATGGSLTETDFSVGGLYTTTYYYASTALSLSATETTLGPITAGLTPTSGQSIQVVTTPTFGMNSPKLYRATAAEGPFNTILTAGSTSVTISGGGNFTGVTNGQYLQGANILPGTYVVSGGGGATLTLNQAPVNTTVTENVNYVGPFSLIAFVPGSQPNALTIGTTVYTGYLFTDIGYGTQTGTLPTTAVGATPAQLWGWLGEPGTNAAFEVLDYFGDVNLKVTRGGGVTANSVIQSAYAVPVASNAGTVPVTQSNCTFTNSSAATMTITLAANAAGAVDGQMLTVRIYDFSAAAETITWVNTENSTVTVPTTSNGSTTLPLTVQFVFNGQTNKWRCILKA